MIRILLVDDEPLALKRLAVALEDIPDAEVIGEARDGDEALLLVEQLRPDLILLDINMPGRDGIAVARTLAAREKRPEVVFITAFDQFAVDAFAIEAVDYLLKPVDFDRLEQAVTRAKRRRLERAAQDRVVELGEVVTALRGQGRAPALRPIPGTEPGAAANGSEGSDSAAFWVPVNGSMVRVPADLIEWVEAARDYVLLRTSTRSYILRATMAEIQSQLGSVNFLRIHRSLIVRRDLIDRVERTGRGPLRLVLRDGARLGVGPSYAEAVCSSLNI
jgi:DNA-binding LytR/AlgR family response regulator